jgi:hypothetical protein
MDLSRGLTDDYVTTKLNLQSTKWAGPAAGGRRSSPVQLRKVQLAGPLERGRHPRAQARRPTGGLQLPVEQSKGQSEGEFTGRGRTPTSADPGGPSG